MKYQLTPEAIRAGWKVHTGQVNPAPGQHVYIMMRCANGIPGHVARPSELLIWDTDGSAGDIVAYQVAHASG